MNRQIHRIDLNKTSRYTANCYCKVTIDYITVTASLCVLVPRKMLTYNNKQTTSLTSRLHRSFIVQSESHQWQWKMINVWHVDGNSVILHLLKINVKIKSVVDRIWKERDIDFVWWNRVKKSCRVRPISHDAIFHAIGPDSSRLPKVGLTRHDCTSHTTRFKSRLMQSRAIASKNRVVWERLKIPPASPRCKTQAIVSKNRVVWDRLKGPFRQKAGARAAKLEQRVYKARIQTEQAVAIVINIYCL